MKTDHLKESNNIEDRRNEGGSASYGSGNARLGNGILRILLAPGSFKSKLVLILLLLFLGGGAGLSGIFDTGTSHHYESTQVSQQSHTQVNDKDAQFVSKVLGTTEVFWTQTFEKEGRTYYKPKLVFYTGQTRTGCGVGQASAGPFYCPKDQKIYLDIRFYQELTTKYRASGDFAMAYVIAHEVGHHIQNQLGTLQSYQQMVRGKSEKEKNALNVRLELQADYYAGVWARYIEQ